MAGARAKMAWVTVCAVASVFMPSASPRAQAMREVRAMPADCRVNMTGGGRVGLRSWQNLIWVEHCDRIKRLQRQSSMLPPDQQPQFFEGVVPASRLPAEFNTDIPVLRVVFPERTFFDTAIAALRPEAEQVTAIIAESLRREPPDVAMFVAGHADARGGRPLNERLSMDRANAIAAQILEAGVNLSSIWRVGFGEDMPLVSGMTPFAWDRNRRVEFLFASRPEAVATWLADQQIDNLCQARTDLEAERCKQKLDFRSGYDAVQLVPKPRQEVRPRVPPRTPVNPSSRQPKVAITPGGARKTAIAPTAVESVAVQPTGPAKFRIDPINRRAPKVRIDPQA